MSDQKDILFNLKMVADPSNVSAAKKMEQQNKGINQTISEGQAKAYDQAGQASLKHANQVSTQYQKMAVQASKAGNATVNIASGFAKIGIASDETNTKLLQGYVIIEGMQSLVKGLISLWGAASKAIKAYYAASALSGAGSAAVTGAVGAGAGSGIGAGAGSLLGSFLGSKAGSKAVSEAVENSAQRMIEEVLKAQPKTETKGGAGFTNWTINTPGSFPDAEPVGGPKPWKVGDPIQGPAGKPGQTVKEGKAAAGARTLAEIGVSQTAEVTAEAINDAKRTGESKKLGLKAKFLGVLNGIGQFVAVLGLVVAAVGLIFAASSAIVNNIRNNLGAETTRRMEKSREYAKEDIEKQRLKDVENKPIFDASAESQSRARYSGQGYVGTALEGKVAGDTLIRSQKEAAKAEEERITAAQVTAAAGKKLTPREQAKLDDLTKREKERRLEGAVSSPMGNSWSEKIWFKKDAKALADLQARKSQLSTDTSKVTSEEIGKRDEIKGRLDKKEDVSAYDKSYAANVTTNLENEKRFLDATVKQTAAINQQKEAVKSVAEARISAHASAMKGLDDEIAKEKDKTASLNSEKARFGELTLGKQMMVAEAIKKAQSGMDLSNEEADLVRSYGGKKEKEAADASGARKGAAVAAALGMNNWTGEEQGIADTRAKQKQNEDILTGKDPFGKGAVDPETTRNRQHWMEIKPPEFQFKITNTEDFAQQVKAQMHKALADADEELKKLVIATATTAVEEYNRGKRNAGSAAGGATS